MVFPAVSRNAFCAVVRNFGVPEVETSTGRASSLTRCKCRVAYLLSEPFTGQRGLPGQPGRVQCSPGHREKLPTCGQSAGIVEQRFFTWCFAEQPWATDSGHEVVAQKTVETMTLVEVEWDLQCFTDDTNMVDRESVLGGAPW